MNAPFRLPQGGRINRSQRADFQFDGKTIEAYQGDTVASALLAAGEKVVARSFKYHRPRGIMGAGVEESNALMTVGKDGSETPNLPATTLEAVAGLQVASQNAWPSVKWDWRAVNSLASPLFSAGFYYKTFMGPFKGTAAWMFFEHHIRKAAGLGKSNELRDQDRYDWHHNFVDVLVVGAGPAGLHAALAAAEAGCDVLLVEQDFELGGSLLLKEQGSAEGQWLATLLARVKAAAPRLRVLRRASAFGLYDGNTVGVVEQAEPGRADAQKGEPKQRFHTVRAGSVVMACGAIERPLVFAGNDRPGVMLASSISAYVNRYGVAPGRTACFSVNNNAAWADALALAATGAKVVLADTRAEVSPALLALARAKGIELHLATAVAYAKGRAGVREVGLAPFDAARGALGPVKTTLKVDLVATSGGFSPTVHLTSHRGVKPVYSEAIGGFVPGGFDKEHFGAGAMVGSPNWQGAAQSGWQAGWSAAQAAAGKAGGPGSHSSPSGASPNPPAIPEALSQDATDAMWAPPLPALVQANSVDKAFIDLQHDVHFDDISLAHREGFVSVEHLKRYTTQGMATDQGKTSNINAMMALAALREKALGDVGTTTFRPPFTPITVGALAGRGVGTHYRPVRRTAMHDWHLANQGRMTEAGYWMRPLWYASHGATLGEAYKAEMALVRGGVGIADVSTLGKIDVQGPDAAAFLDRVYVNGFSKLPVGKARYGFMLREDGIVLDDGTTSRLADDRFFMTTTTGQAARVMSHLEFLLQVVWPELRVTVASSSDQWAAMSVAGPKVRELLAKALPQVDFSTEALPHMGIVESVGVGPLAGMPMRVMRMTFSGELAYEVYVPTHFGHAMWTHLFEVGEAFGLQPYGLEALASLRIEKGHVVGSEMDGRTTLDDMGAGGMASKLKPFWGDALRKGENLVRPDRPTLVGLEVVNAGESVSNGAILFFTDDEIKGCGRGHVSSNCYSHEVGKMIALGLLQGGKQHIGKEILAVSPVQNRNTRLRVVDPCFIDAEGARYKS
jgi:sarcosine oxidase subunit alpha